MVHALREARRVLKPGGVLIDLRPGLQHRRVSVVRGSQARPVGVMRESFDDVHAANQAVANVVSQRLLRFERRQRLDCDRVMDGAGDFRDWLADFVSRDDSLPAHDWLVERLERALARERGKAKVVVAGPLEMRVLTKTVRARPPRLKDPKNSG